MRRFATLFSIWLVVTSLAVLVANTAVSSVRGAVTDTPYPLGLPTVSPAVVAARSSAPPVGVVESDPEGTYPRRSEAAPAVVGSETSAGTAAAAPVEAPPPAVTTVGGEVATYETDGGWVTIRVMGTEVFFEGAGPKQGWKIETESTGPTSVVVKFERPEKEITFKAGFEQGVLDVRIES
jgi:hypothetical protein